MQIKNVAVVGPRGSVGSAIIEKLLQNGTFNITALVRSSSTYVRPPTQTAVKVVTTNFDDQATLAQHLQGHDALLCSVSGGATRFGPQKTLIDAAIDAGVKLFFASEYSANIMGPHYQIFPTEVVGDKVTVRKYLEEKASAGEMAWTAINGGPFFDMWLEKGVAGFNIPARTAIIYGTGSNLACWTPLPVTASAVVTMLLNPTPILNRAVFISSVRNLTQNTILAALEAEVGVKFEVKHVDVKKIRAEALQALEKGDLKTATRGLTINAQFNEEGSAANFWDLVDNELVGVEAVDVRVAVREYLRTINAV